MKNLKLTKKEVNLLAELMDYNKKLEKVFFSDKKNADLISMIDDVIESKLKGVNSELAFKMLNSLYRYDIDEELPGTEIKILNGLSCNLAKERLGILLLKIAITNKNFFKYQYQFSCPGFEIYMYNNMFYYYLNNYPLLNYLFILDHAESFLGLINSDEMISPDLRNDITNKFLFLYKDLYIELKDKKINITTTSILSNRYDAFANMYLHSSSQVKDDVSITPFYQQALEMLNVNDESIQDYSNLIVGKHYLDNILNHISISGFKSLSETYKEIEQSLSLDGHYEAFNYIHQSLNEKANKVNKKRKNFV